MHLVVWNFTHLNEVRKPNPKSIQYGIYNNEPILHTCSGTNLPFASIVPLLPHPPQKKDLDVFDLIYTELCSIFKVCINPPEAYHCRKFVSNAGTRPNTKYKFCLSGCIWSLFKLSRFPTISHLNEMIQIKCNQW